MNEWWRYFVDGRDDIYGIDAAIIMNPRTWVASGHLATFADPLVECKECKSRFRADKIAEGISESVTNEEFLATHTKCPVCGKNVVRGKFSYGCMGFEDGCKFRVGINICHRDIPIDQARRLLAEGSTDVLTSFVSKNGKYFKARLILKDGNAVFDFPT